MLMFRMEDHAERCLCCHIKRLVSLQPECTVFLSASLSLFLMPTPRVPRTPLRISQVAMALVPGRAGRVL